MQIDQLWSKTDAVFRRDVSDDVADIWLSQLAPAAFEDGVLYLTGTDRARSWVELRYGRVLNRCAAKAAGAEVRVTLVSEAEIPALARVSAQEPASTEWHTSPLNPRYSFDQFVIGASNHIGHAAALAV